MLPPHVTAVSGDERAGDDQPSGRAVLVVGADVDPTAPEISSGRRPSSLDPRPQRRARSYLNSLTRLQFELASRPSRTPAPMRTFGTLPAGTARPRAYEIPMLGEHNGVGALHADHGRIDRSTAGLPCPADWPPSAIARATVRGGRGLERRRFDSVLRGRCSSSVSSAFGPLRGRGGDRGRRPPSPSGAVCLQSCRILGPRGSEF
jgi:hypothetical protein